MAFNAIQIEGALKALKMKDRDLYPLVSYYITKISMQATVILFYFI